MTRAKVVVVSAACAVGAWSMALRGAPPIARAAPPADEAAAALGLKVAPGFRVEQYVAENLVSDVYSLAVTPAGRIAVSSEGWIKVLHDDDGDGAADRAEIVAHTNLGSLGLLIEEDRAFSVQERGLVEHRRDQRTGRLTEPRVLAAINWGEHGGHALRRGPDGWLYWLIGNEVRPAPLASDAPESPVRAPHVGRLLRYPPDGDRLEVVADGFRNPYRFDFSPDGEALVYEANGERELGLPWYLPTRLFQVGHGLHHGWMLDGWTRSPLRPDHFPDTVPILARLGEGSPTGALWYRHDRLPPRYRDGVFLLDWSFGTMTFVPLARVGAGYAASAPERILESVGTAGFAPSDMAVGPDGAIYVSIGGRGTRGSVYRVSWDGAPPIAPRVAAPPMAGAAAELVAVLRAPQPLEPWSRRRWLPSARALGAERLIAAARDPRWPAADRVRAIEIVTELAVGLSPELAADLLRDADPLVRARAAWALGRAPAAPPDAAAPRSGPTSAALLAAAMSDPDPWVRRAAIEAYGDRHAAAPQPELVTDAIAAAWRDPDRRLALAATWLASRLDDARWTTVRDAAAAAHDARVRLGAALAGVWRGGGRAGGLPESAPARAAAVDAALAALAEDVDPGVWLLSLRLLMLAYGDLQVQGAAPEVLTMFSLRHIVPDADARRIEATLLARFPSGDELVDQELARLAAMVGARDPRWPARIAAKWGPATPPARDVHYLAAMGRLRGARDRATTAATVGAALALPGKLRPEDEAILQNWQVRVLEILGELAARDPGFAPALARDPRLLDGRRAHLALGLLPAARAAAARRLLPRLAPRGPIPWSDPIFRLLAELPPATARRALLARWDDPAARDGILLALARRPLAADRGRFATGLASFQPEVVAACLGALETLPPDGAPETAAALVRLLRALTQDGAQKALRARVLAQYRRVTGAALAIEETDTRRAELLAAYQPVWDDFARRHPALAAPTPAGDGGLDAKALHALLATVPWDEGDAKRGEIVVAQRACLSCHGGMRSFGPALAGAASRMSRQDLFDAIAFPSIDVSPLYRAQVVTMKSGETFTGLVRNDSPPWLLLMLGPGNEARLPMEDIADRRPTDASLMPAGLLEGLAPRELADMYAYLRALK